MGGRELMGERGELTGSRGELAVDRGELTGGRGELAVDRGELAVDRGELAWWRELPSGWRVRMSCVGSSASSGGGAGTVLGALGGMTIVLSSPSCPCCKRPVACSSKPCLTRNA